VLPAGGSFDLDETLGAVTARLRKSMAQQLSNLEQLKVLKEPLSPVDGAPLMISNPGPARMPGFIITGLIQEIVRNVDPKDSSEWAYLLTHAANSFGDRPQIQWILSHANRVVLSEDDVRDIERMAVKGLLTLTLDLTVRQALQQIQPAIKRAVP
jgi:hypothetical protein